MVGSRVADQGVGHADRGGALPQEFGQVSTQMRELILPALAEPGMKARFAELGGNVLPGSPSHFGELVSEDAEKWGKVIRTAGIKARRNDSATGSVACRDDRTAGHLSITYGPTPLEVCMAPFPFLLNSLTYLLE